MSRTSAGTALKTAACCWSDRVVSALRNHVHYIVNYVFGGRGARGPEGRSGCEMPVGRLGADHRRAHSPDSEHPPTTAINVEPLKATLGH